MASTTALPALAYQHVIRRTRAHYENFPVASRLLPGGLERHIAAVYVFARQADDFADEPEYAGRRLELLAEWEERLLAAAAGRPDSDPAFVALSHTIRELDLPVAPFRDLLTAFRRDVTTSRHPDFPELLDYCRYSANPVGRLVLLLVGVRDAATFALSDAVTTALQLANFWQDVAVDLAKDRIYLPQDDMARFGVSEDDLRAGRATPSYRALLAFEVERTRELFARGWSVADRVRGRLRLELRLTCWGGWTVLDKIAALDFDTLNARPVVSKGGWARLFLRALLDRRPAFPGGTP